jgi:multidrug resistance efflux pump
MTTKPRQHGEAKRIGLIKASLILGSLIASLLGLRMLVDQEAPPPAVAAVSRETIQAAPAAPGQVQVVPVVPNQVQIAPVTPRQVQIAPVTRSRSS